MINRMLMFDENHLWFTLVGNFFASLGTLVTAWHDQEFFLITILIYTGIASFFFFRRNFVIFINASCVAVFCLFFIIFRWSPTYVYPGDYMYHMICIILFFVPLILAIRSLFQISYETYRSWR